jgi:hypothetical protein
MDGVDPYYIQDWDTIDESLSEFLSNKSFCFQNTASEFDAEDFGAYSRDCQLDESLFLELNEYESVAPSNWDELKDNRQVPSRTEVSDSSIKGTVRRPRRFRKHHCQADGCQANLAELSFYFQRNHICKDHLKSDEFLIDGNPSRFCQRCGFAHPIIDFEGQRKSCKTSLEKHNLRRRQRQAGELQCST